LPPLSFLLGASNDNKQGSKPNKGSNFFGLTFIIENRWPKKESERRVRKTKTNGDAKKFAANCF